MLNFKELLSIVIYSIVILEDSDKTIPIAVKYVKLTEVKVIFSAYSTFIFDPTLIEEIIGKLL